MLEYAHVEGELELVMRMAKAFAPFVVLGFLRFLANCWPTTRRMSGKPHT